jgi:arsenate reductase-like glutaredoxin family protein
MNQKVKDIKNLRRLTDHLTADTNTEELTATTEQLLDQHNWIAEATVTLKEMPMDRTTLQQWREKLGTQIQETITRLEQVRTDQQKELKLKGQEAFRAKLSTHAKVVHRSIFNKTT